MLQTSNRHPVWPGRLCALGHAVALALAASFPVSVLAETKQPPSQSPLDVFQQQEDRLFQTGYRLALANAPFCQRRTHGVGILIHDAASYRRPDVVRAHFSLRGDVAIQSVATGSPAYNLGIRQNDTLASVMGIDVEALANSGEKTWERAARINRMLAEPGPEGLVHIARADDQGPATSFELEPVELCASRFELQSGNSKAAADGERVLVGDSFPAFAYSTPKFAAALAHEMAHNLLGHLDHFEKYGRRGGRVRKSERDADRLMPWLLYNAGYDPQAAVEFMREWGPRHGGGILRKRTHDGWDERVELIEAELPRIEAVATDGKADWQIHFVPMLTEED